MIAITESDDVRSPDTISVRPGVGMLALFPSMKYKPWYALGELVDNAIQSYLSNKRALIDQSDGYLLRIEIEVASDSITVRDNAAGIKALDIPRAFAPAQPPPDNSGLSQFGIGMKSAACWYAKRFTVVTTAIHENVTRTVVVDIPKVIESSSDEVDVETSPRNHSGHGTTVTLERLNQPAPTGRTLGKIRKYLGSIYRGFIAAGEIELIVAGEALKYRGPAILNAPRWNSDGEAQRWRKDVTIVLPASGRRVTGWVAIREKGSTSEAGLALVHRGKVVVGAGSMAQDSEGSYRPEAIFGRTNSFAYQRVFGELDVSELAVAYSKDDLVWAGEEDDFIDALAAEVDAEPLPLIKMANLYRKSDHAQDVDVVDEVQKAAQAAATAVSRTFETSSDTQEQHAKQRMTDTRTARQNTVASPPISVDIPLPPSFGESVRLMVVHERFESKLLRIVRENGAEVIRFNRAAPFMLSFANLPEGDIEPILRLCLALALAEIQARSNGVADAAVIRTKLNDLLEGPLAHRMDVKA